MMENAPKLCFVLLLVPAHALEDSVASAVEVDGGKSCEQVIP